MEIIFADPFEIDIPEVRARSTFTEEEREELKLSIKQEGIKVPLQCFRDPSGRLILAEGEERLEIACELKKEKVPVQVLGEGTAVDAIKHSLATSIKGRRDPVSVAHAAKWLMKRYGVELAEIARLLGKTKPTTTMLLSTLNLAGEVQVLVSSGRIGIRRAYEIQKIENLDVQVKVAHKCVENQWPQQTLSDVVERIKGYRKTGLSWEDAYTKTIREKVYWLRGDKKCAACGELFKREELLRVLLCSECLASFQSQGLLRA